MSASNQSSPPVTNDHNPYSPPATTGIEKGSGAMTWGLDIVAWLAVIACIISLAFWILTTVVSLPYGHPNAPPLLHILGFTGMFMVLPSVSLAGSIFALQRRRYKVALAGMICLLIAVLGPCFGLTIPLGIFGMIFLWPSRVKDSFAT